MYINSRCGVMGGGLKHVIVLVLNRKQHTELHRTSIQMEDNGHAQGE